MALELGAIRSGAALSRCVHLATILPLVWYRAVATLYQGPGSFVLASQHAAVANEPVFSNLRDTIAMAKLASSVNSATNQWLINMLLGMLNLWRQRRSAMA